MIARRLHHLANPRRIANIARIDPQTGGTGLGCLDGAAIMEMDIGNNRNRTLRTNGFQRRGAVFIGAGHPHNISTGRRRRIDLRQGAVNITCQAVGHGLHRNWRIAANRN